LENNDVVIGRGLRGCHIWNLATDESSQDVIVDDDALDDDTELGIDEDKTGTPSGS
jgi:hypothetical protein